MSLCKIIIQDEVNCKLANLDLNVRKKLVNQFKFEIPGARYLPAVRLGRWDGKVAFFNLGGTTFINLLPEILPVLDAHGYQYDLEDLRPLRLPFEFPVVTKDEHSQFNWPKGHFKENQPIELDDHQLEVINSFFTNHQSMTQASTGAGKTIVTATLSKHVEPYGKSLIIVPNKSLVTQTEADYKLLGLEVGVFFGDRKEVGRTHTICTWQSLSSVLRAARKGEEAKYEISDIIDGVVAVIVDEAHGVKGDDLKSMLGGPLAHIPLRWGLTGTIPKEKYAATALRVCLGEVVSRVTAAELQDKGFLSNCHVNIVQLQDHSEFKQYQQELAYLVGNDDRLAFLATLLAKISNNNNTLILVDRIATGQVLQAYLSTLLNEEVSFVSGSTKGTRRTEEYKSIADANGKVIISTYGVAAVGLNIPRIFNLVMIEPGKSFVRVIQSIGRGLRKAHDKDHVEIWDITSSCKFSKRHLTQRKQFYAEADYPYSIEKLDWKK